MSLYDEVKAVSRSKADVQKEEYQKDYDYGILTAELCISEKKFRSYFLKK